MRDGRNSVLLFLAIFAVAAVIILITELAHGDASGPVEPRGASPVVSVETEIESEPPGAVATVQQIEDYIKRFLSTWYKPGTGKRWSQVPEMSRWIYEEALAANVDPFMLAVTVKYESGFQVRQGLGIEGKKGERGLGQLHGMARNRALRAGCDLETPRGQLRGAALWLRAALDACGGDELKAFRAYQTGDCRIKTAGSTFRFSELVRLRKTTGGGHGAHL